MISVHNLSKQFYLLPVLHRINFTVERGKSFIILGKSGSGKSVLLKTITNLLPSDEGTVHIQSQNIGMVFQKNALFDSMTVEENLDFPLRERTSLSTKERKKEINSFLEAVELPNTNNLYPHELSGGMQKRLGIARTLITQPEVVFYDEPTAGLDPITSRMIADLILRLKASHKVTLVAVTSDVLRAYQLGDELGLLIPAERGATLKMAGTPEQARNSKEEDIQQFLKGLTHGPLTSDLSKPMRDPTGIALTERMDVDFF